MNELVTRGNFGILWCSQELRAATQGDEDLGFGPFWDQF